MRRTLFAASLLAVSASAFAARAQKIGYVDVQRAIQETEEGKAARTRLKGEFETRRAQIDKKSQDLEKMQQEYDKQQAVLSDDAKKKKQEEFQKLLIDTRKSASELQEDLAGKEQQAMQSILQKLNTVVAEIAERESIGFVMDKASLLYAPQAADITNEVVRRYNDRFGAGEKGQAPKTTAKKNDAPAPAKPAPTGKK
jgi:outer membrane protein